MSKKPKILYGIEEGLDMISVYDKICCNKSTIQHAATSQR